MESFEISSSQLILKVHAKGAELTSVKDKSRGFEFIWQANPDIWARHAPVLFPVVGKLYHDKILIGSKHFQITQHGFARDSRFELVELYGDMIRYMLESNDLTKKVYPYDFKFFVMYEVKDKQVKISYTVINTGSDTLFYSVGAHPAFNLPLKDLSKYSILFKKPENLERLMLNQGNFNGLRENLGTNQSELKLSNDLFIKDAIVFQNLKSKQLALVQHESIFKIDLQFEGFPYLGIWAKYPNQEFICLEPWAGLADSVAFNGDISEKKGIISVEPLEEKTFAYTISFSAP
ncbi:MAG: aldose 1-epimerase family protein [Bacteroidota bacterium]|nr:aldose 1-epimerase family protein [Bacteroidota bacterium]